MKKSYSFITSSLVCFVLVFAGGVLAQDSSAVTAKVHTYSKNADGKVVRDGPLNIKYTRVKAGPQEIRHMKGYDSSAEVIVTAACKRTSKPAIRHRVGYRHPTLRHYRTSKLLL